MGAWGPRLHLGRDNAESKDHLEWRQHGGGSTEEIKPVPVRREDQFPQDPQEHGDGHNGR